MLTDIGGTFVASVLLLVIYGAVLTSKGEPPEQITRIVAQRDPTSALSLTGLALGISLSLLGGYVCARVARQAELKWTAVTATISTGLGAVMGAEPLSWFKVLLVALTFGSVMLGGYAGARRNARARADEQTR